MSYTSFKDIDEVCDKFDCYVKQELFIKKKEFKINDFFEKKLKDNYGILGVFVNEISICERIISPILELVACENNLPLWSHCPLNVDESLNLNGSPDYILAPTSKGGGRFTTPVVCLVEAKRDDFISGWAQVAAEMIASQKKNNNIDIPIFGLVSSGKVWEFGMLQKNQFLINKDNYLAPKELNDIFNILNWMFGEARKNADKLAEFANNNN